MSPLVLFVFVSLCAYRVWRLLALDVVLDRPRGWLIGKLGVERSAWVSCSWCAGWWVSAAVVGAVWSQTSLPLPALWFGGVSTVVGMLAQYDEG